MNLAPITASTARAVHAAARLRPREQHPHIAFILRRAEFEAEVEREVEARLRAWREARDPESW